MNKKTFLIVLPLLLLTIGAFAGCIRGVEGDSPAPVGEQDVTSDTHLPNVNLHTIEGDHVSVDPRVVEDLEEEEWVSVYIEMSFPPGFVAYTGQPREVYEEIVAAWDMELYDQLRAERRANLVSALGPDLEQRRAAGDFINASGLEKLRISPYVSWVGGDYDASLSEVGY